MMIGIGIAETMMMSYPVIYTDYGSILMNMGMLWLDDDKQTSFEEKIRLAADYYKEKYGQTPDLCLVNQKMLAEEKRVDKIQVQPVHHVLINHFWVGVKNS
jgi:hypothetical protein